MLSDNDFQLYKCRSRANFSQFVRRVFSGLNLKVERKMKIILLSVVILCLAFGNILADQTITCKFHQGIEPACYFPNNLTIGPNETVRIEVDPADTDVSTILTIFFGYFSSIYSIPQEIFTKFPNVKWLGASGCHLQEIKADTFKNAKQLSGIDLRANELTFLDPNTFKGKNLLYNFNQHFNRMPIILKVCGGCNHSIWRETN
jgi:hypothetical protein